MMLVREDALHGMHSAGMFVYYASCLMSLLPLSLTRSEIYTKKSSLAALH